MRVSRTLRYPRSEPLLLQGNDLFPDAPQDVFQFAIKSGRALPSGLVFSGLAVHSDSLLVEPHPISELAKLRLAITSWLKPRVSFPGNAIIFVNGYYRNYYHFVLECLTRLFLVKNWLEEPSTVVICPDDVQSFHTQWFDLLGIANRTRFLPNSTIVAADRIITSSFPAPADNHHRLVLNDFRTWILNAMGTRPSATVTDTGNGDKFFVGRKAGLYRMILNMDAVRSLCARHGYQYIELDDMPLPKQLATFATATHIVATHGAGLANLIVSREGMSIIELINRKFHNRTFEKISLCLGLEHQRLDCEPAAPSGSPEAATTSARMRKVQILVQAQRADITVDLEALERAILRAG